MLAAICQNLNTTGTKAPRTSVSTALIFEDAQRLWADPGVMEIPARTSDEPRWLSIEKIDEKHWSAIITRRGENIRLISLRRSRDEEVTLYESEDI